MSLHTKRPWEEGGRCGPHRHLRGCGRRVQPGTRGSRAPPPPRTVPRPGRLAGRGHRGPRAGFAADRAPLAPAGRAAVRDVPSPLVLARRFAGRGLWSAGPGRRAAAAAAGRPPLPSSGRPPAPLLARRRALPAELGRVCGAGRTGRRAPSPAAGLRGSPGPARARSPARSVPALPLRVPIPLAAPFCVSVRARSPHGRPRSQPFVSRAPAPPGLLLACATGFGVARPGPCSPVPEGKAA